jgi:hypothetical protein
MDEVKKPGYYTITWDSRDRTGRQVTSGVYFLRLKAGEFETTKKMVFLK